MDQKFLKMNQMVIYKKIKNDKYTLYVFFIIDLLDHIDSEDESEISDDSCKKSPSYSTSSKRMVPEQ